MNEQIYKSEKKLERGDRLNLTVYVNIIDEKQASPEQLQARDKAREIYAQWIEEITVTEHR